MNIYNSAGVSRKVVDDYPTSAQRPCSQFLVESELLIYFCFCMYILVILFFVVCVSFPCLVFVWITFFKFPLESWFPWLLFPYSIEWKIGEFYKTGSWYQRANKVTLNVWAIYIKTHTKSEINLSNGIRDSCYKNFLFHSIQWKMGKLILECNNICSQLMSYFGSNLANGSQVFCDENVWQIDKLTDRKTDKVTQNYHPSIEWRCKIKHICAANTYRYCFKWVDCQPIHLIK